MLSKTTRRKLYQYVVEELGLRIIQGRFQPGDTLPNEDALCQEYDVSRGVLREATKVLIEKGLILSRPKTGTQVQPRKEWNLFDPDVLKWKAASVDKYAFLKNITEVRRIIEAEAARFAAERAEEKEVERIHAVCNEMVELLSRKAGYTREEFIVLDLKFHAAIMDASHNELLAQLGHTMRQALLTGRKIDQPDHSSQLSSLKSHQAILRAIADHDALAAQETVQAHIDDVWRDMQALMNPADDVSGE